MSVAAAEGDADPAEFALFAFPGGAGTVQANLDRWQKQFSDKEGNPPEIIKETSKGKDGLEVTFAETHGHFVTAAMPGVKKMDKENWRLLGAIVQSDDTSYFIKMVGPDKTMKAAKKDFEAMLKTIAVESK